MSNFLGKDGFIWFIGTVIDRKDPLLLGRCKLRIKGIHGENGTHVSNENLPWAQPMNPSNHSQHAPSTLREGEIVIGFFMDGEQAQYPIIIGALPIIAEEIDKNNVEFKDPRTEEDLKNSPQNISLKYNLDGKGVEITNNLGSNFPKNINEPTTSRLSRSEFLNGTILTTKKNSRTKGVKIYDEKSSWDEPENPYKAQYPYNHVTETESGHVLEFDDTKGAERIHLYHRNGSFFEMHPNGDKVEKITKNNYQIILSDDNVYIMGKCNITVQNDANINVQKNCNIHVTDNMNIKVDGNVNWDIKGSMTWNIGKETKWNFDNSLTWNVGTTAKWNIASQLDIKSPVVNIN